MNEEIDHEHIGSVPIPYSDAPEATLDVFLGPEKPEGRDRLVHVTTVGACPSETIMEMMREKNMGPVLAINADELEQFIPLLKQALQQLRAPSAGRRALMATEQPWIDELAQLRQPSGEVFICIACHHLHLNCTCPKSVLEPLIAQQTRIAELERENERLRQALDNMLSWALDGHDWRDGNDRKALEWRQERDEAMALLATTRPTEGTNE